MTARKHLSTHLKQGNAQSPLQQFQCSADEPGDMHSSSSSWQLSMPQHRSGNLQPLNLSTCGSVKEFDPEAAFPMEFSNSGTMKTDEKLSGDLPNALLKKGYQKLKKLGGGSFGTALLVAKQDTYLVCKTVEVDVRYYESIEREAVLLSQLEHQNIVRCHEHFYAHTDEAIFLCIIMDYCEYGDLGMYLKEQRDIGKNVNSERLLLFVHAIRGLKYLHRKNIIHRDLKPANLLLTKEKLVLLADFGLAKELAGGNTQTRSICGTGAYMAPEVQRGFKYGPPADIFSMGCVLFEIMTLIRWRRSEGLSMVDIKAYSLNVKELCRKMLNGRAKDRPTAIAICEDFAQQVYNLLVQLDQTRLDKSRPITSSTCDSSIQEFDPEAAPCYGIAISQNPSDSQARMLSYHPGQHVYYAVGEPPGHEIHCVIVHRNSKGANRGTYRVDRVTGGCVHPFAHVRKLRLVHVDSDFESLH